MHHQASTQQGDRLANANTDVSNMDSKPEALPVAHRGVGIYGRPWNQHTATSTCNPFAVAVHTRNVSSVVRAHEFGTAIAKATDNMIRIGMINQYQNRELVIKFRREVRASLAYEQLLNYHNGSSPVVQAQGVNPTPENIHDTIMQTLDRMHFTNNGRPF